MNRTLIITAVALSTIGGAFSAFAVTPTAQHRQQMAAPSAPPAAEQPYPVYHDSPTASYFSKPGAAAPCHFTEAFVEGKMRQVEVCN